ncbi:MAG: hypothetical protein WD894_14725 [Pirellulales bacterium]
MLQVSRVTASVGILLVVLDWSVARPVHAQATFVGLGTFGASRSEAHDISADGTVIVGVVFEFPDSTHGVFRWTRNQSTIYRELVRTKVAVSDDGTTVVGSRYFGIPGLDEAFRWVPDEGLFEGLGDFPGGAFDSAAYGVSADGSVIVGSGNANQSPRAFRWTAEEGMVDIGPGTAYGISSAGNVIVGAAETAFRWTAATGMVELAPLPGSIGSRAYAISPEGTVAVGEQIFRATQSSVRQEASRWIEQGVISLESELWASTVALDVSVDGTSIVGGGIPRLSGARTAFFWSPQTGMVGVQDLLISLGATGLDGWALTQAYGVSHDGRTIVGQGIHNGRSEAWVATIPEPSSIIQLAVAAAGFLGFAVFKAIRSNLRVTV